MRDIEETLLNERRRIAAEIIGDVLRASAAEYPDDPLAGDSRIDVLTNLLLVSVPQLLHVQLALCNRAGMSWDAMASESGLGVSRQGFHKRFSSGVNQLLEDAASGALASSHSFANQSAAHDRDASIRLRREQPELFEDEPADAHIGQLAEQDAAGIGAARDLDLYLALLGRYWRSDLPDAIGVWRDRTAAKGRWWGD